MNGLGNWMQQYGIVAYKVFSATDASDLPLGWIEPREFSLDGVVFYDGHKMILFTDVVHSVLVKDKKTQTKDIGELQDWIDKRFTDKDAPYTLVSYGSRKFDAPLLHSEYDIPHTVGQVDLREMISDASKEHHGESYGRRYDLRSLSVLNNAKQTAIPHLSFLMKPIELLAEWKRGMERNVLKTLAAEVELIAELYCTIMVREELRIIDQRTERPATVQCDFVRDTALYRFIPDEKELDSKTKEYREKLIVEDESNA